MTGGEIGWFETFETEDAITIDGRLRSYALRQACQDFEIGLLLRRGYLLRVHELGGFASFHEYAAYVFGYSGRMTEDRLRVAEALEELPGLAVKLAHGELCWSVVRELSRVVIEETEPEWIAAAEGKTAHEVEKIVSGRELGDRPDSPAKEKARVHRLSMRVSADTYALWQDMRRVLVSASGESISDDELLAVVARCVLEGPRDDGKSNYQIAIHVCDECKRTTQRAGNEHVVIDDVALETALCDAQHIGDVESPTPTRAKQSIPPSTRRNVIERDGGKCAVPSCRHDAFIDLHHTHLRSEGGDHNADKLVSLCSAHHRMTHAGRLVIKGTYKTGFRFEHADGTSYGSKRIDSARADERAREFERLIDRGFEEREARAMLDSFEAHVGPPMR